MNKTSLNNNGFLMVDNIKKHLEDRYLEISIDFFLLFSRFEYALKTIRAFSNSRSNGYGEYAEANWKAFTEEIERKGIIDYSETTDLRTAFDVIMNDPPRKLKFDETKNGLVPTPNLVKVDSTKTAQLREHIKTIRNNLFHGGKFTDNHISGSNHADRNTNERDYNLIKSAIIILNKWLSLSDEVKERFITF